jgi:hypothetical protein
MATVWERFRQTALHGNVVLNFTSYPKGELAVYGLAYRDAADALVNNLRHRHGYSDVDACPIVFLYRHSIELYMKAIILWGAGLVRLQSGEYINTDELFTTHKFRDLLPSVRRVFKEAGWDDNRTSDVEFGTFSEIEEFVLAFGEIDPRAFAFRYPIDRAGNASLPENFYFNVIALGDEAHKMLTMLDGAATGVYEMFQAMASLQHEVAEQGW